MQRPIRYKTFLAVAAMMIAAIVTFFTPLVRAQKSSRDIQRYSVKVTNESAVIYDIVSTVTMDALPLALQNNLQDLQNVIRAAGQKIVYQNATNTAINNQAAEHYLILNASTLVLGKPDGEVSHQLAAARAFPRNRRQARQLFQKHGLKKGGKLPWVLIDHHASLQAAFESQQSEAVAQEIAAVVHFSADAAMAFHVSGNGFASVSTRKAKQEGRHNEGDQKAAAWWQSEPLYKRCQIESLAWSRSRFEHETRVWPDRIKPLNQPIDVVFKIITQAFELRSELIALDREICASLVINNEQDFSKRADAYYHAMSERAGHLHRLQLENGALLAARLITDAWQQAGRLSIEPISSGNNQPNNVKDDKINTKIDKLVGSKSSKVFHNASCPHAKRIANKNLVPFDSAQTATKQGRRPCRTCQPK